MGRHRRQTQHLRMICPRRREPSPKVLETRRVAFSILIEGLQPSAFLRGMWWNDCICEGNAKLYKEMANIGNAIISMAEESMEKAMNEITPGTVISFDGSWDHRRHGSNCIHAVFSCQTQKIIQCQLVSNKIPPTS